jgi:hypothetical protein
MESQTNIWIIWLIFALFFGLLAYYHWRLSKKIIPQFKLPKILYWRPTMGIPVDIVHTDEDVKWALDKFRDGFNSYIKDYNESSGRQNRLQALGYLVAFFMAIFSLSITI